MDAELTLEKLNQKFNFDPKTCQISLKSGRRLKCVKLGKRMYPFHRIVWLLVHGRWPSVLEHVDGNPENHHISNLREITRAEIQWKISAKESDTERLPSDRQSSVAGVHWDEERKKWRARIRANYKRVNLGFFTERADAEKAANEARARLHVMVRK